MQRHPPAHPSKRLPPRLRRLRRYFVQSFRKLASALRQQHSACVQLIRRLRRRQHHFGKRALFLELPRAFRASRQMRLNAFPLRFRHFIPNVEDQQRRDFVATLLFRPAHCAVFGSREIANSSPSLPSFPGRRRSLAASVPDSASSRKQSAPAVKAVPSLSRSAPGSPSPSGSAPDPASRDAPAAAQKNRRSPLRVALSSPPAPDLPAATAAAAVGRGTRSSQCGKATCKSCIQTGTGAGSDKP